MTGLDLPSLLAIALTFFAAGVVKGVTGMGLPTVAMGILGAIMPPVAAASLLIVPSFLTNLWQLVSGPGLKVLAARLWPMMLGIVAGTLAGSSLLASGSARLTTTALGVALALYSAFGLLARPLSVPARAEGLLSPAVGLSTGLVTGGTGVFVIPAVPYLQALSLGKDDLVQALGLSFTVSTVALAVGLAGGGALQPGGLAASALAVVPAVLGMQAGQRLRRAIPPARFRRWFLIGLLLLGLELAARPFL